MSPTVTLVWYLVVAGPQGGMVALPGYFDRREECTSAVSEYQKQPAPAGWSASCLPSTSPYGDESDETTTDEQPAQ
ncbi:MAG: hypothetical protein NTV73_12425 [Hyphomicrobiales bacterium]|nr:hypothetical protein [Hyphomicrobiales bacterium]